MSHPIEDIMSTTMQKIREMVDANTIVGTPITTADGITLIPISRLSFGFASGGSDIKGKPAGNDGQLFGGGGGAGVHVTPVAFIVISNGSARIIPIAPPANTTVDRVIDLVPDVMDRIKKYFEERKEGKV